MGSKRGAGPLDDKIAALEASGLARSRRSALRLLRTNHLTEALAAAGFSAEEARSLAARDTRPGVWVPFIEALRSSVMPVVVGILIAGLAAVAGGAAGNLIAALAGILIATSTASSYAAETKAAEMRLEYEANLLGLGRQLLNVHGQVQNALDDPNLPALSAAVLENVRQNVFFAVDQVRDHLPVGRLQLDVGETRAALDRVAGAAAERAREAEEAGDTLTAAYFERILSDEVREAVDAPAQLQRHTRLPQSGRFEELAGKARRTLPVPPEDEPLEAWRIWLQSLVSFVWSSRVLGMRIDGMDAVRLTDLGQVVSRALKLQGVNFPAGHGLRRRSIQISYALTGSKFCVAHRGQDRAAVFLRSGVPEGWDQEEDVLVVDGEVRVDAKPTTHRAERYRTLLQRTGRAAIPISDLKTAIRLVRAAAATPVSRSELPALALGNHSYDEADLKRWIRIFFDANVLVAHQEGDVVSNDLVNWNAGIPDEAGATAAVAAFAAEQVRALLGQCSDEEICRLLRV